jgi:hypothetical protein
MSVIIKEHENYIRYSEKFGNCTASRMEQKWLCVNGPFEGKRLTSTQIKENAGDYKGYRTRTGSPRSGYASYNRASSYRDTPTTVWVWLENPNA